MSDLYAYACYIIKQFALAKGVWLFCMAGMFMKKLALKHEIHTEIERRSHVPKPPLCIFSEVYQKAEMN